MQSSASLQAETLSKLTKFCQLNNKLCYALDKLAGNIWPDAINEL